MALAAGVAGLTLIGGFAGTAAATTPSVGIAAVGQSGWFTPAVTPGGSVTETVRVANPGTATTTYEVGGVWAGTGPTTGMGYGRVGQAPPPVVPPVNEWFGPGATVTIAPGQTALVPITLTVPPGTASGQWVGGIGAEPEATAPGTATGSVTLVSTVEAVVAVVITVPGPASTQMTLGSPSLTQDWVMGTEALIPMANTGGLIAAPVLDVTITSCIGGAPVYGLARQLMATAPHTSWTYRLITERKLPAGCYGVATSLMSGGAVLATNTSDVQLG